MQDNPREQLRFGVMCNGKTLQQWQAQSIGKILDLSRVTLTLLIVEPGGKRRIRKIRPGHFLFQVYRNLFVKPPALKPVDVNELFLDIPRITCVASKKGRFSEYFSDDDVERIQSYDLDFILRFSYGILQGRILSAARYGIWSFHHGDETKYRGRPACFWEIFYGDPVTGAMLQRITERLDAGIVLKKGHFRTKNTSYAQNLQLVCSESSRWPSQVCIDILNDKAPYLVSPPSTTRAKIFSRPRNRETFLFISKLLTNRLIGLYRLFFHYSFWNIGLVNAPIDTFLDPGYKPEIKWLPRPRKGEFKADPFGISHPPNIQVFFENLDYRAPKGIIYTAEISEGALISEPRTVIELPVHMSYPYLIEYEGEIYCIPETNRAREISVYKAQKFPYEWKKSTTLLSNVMAIDSTVFQHQDRWWLMFTDRKRGGDANLYVWYSPDLWGPWKPHANNPVKSDVRSARPGGTPFTHNGFLYRPAQDCSETGGGRLIINRVSSLTPIEFKEEPIVAVEPDKSGPFPEGLHTLSKVDNYTLIDGKRFGFFTIALVNSVVKGIKRTLDLDV